MQGGESYEDLIIERLMARGHYDRVVDLLRAELEERPRDVTLRTRLADALEQNGHADEARFILAAVADEHAKAGSVEKGIAAVKRAGRLGGDTDALERRLVTLVASQGTAEDAKEGAKGALAATSLFADFTQAELAALVRGLRLAACKPGDIILTEGQEGQSLFILVEGKVKVWARDPLGRSVAIREMNGGDFFGEIALLEGGARTATITAVTRCELLELHQEELSIIEREHPRVRDVIARSYRERTHNPLEERVRGRRERPDS